MPWAILADQETRDTDAVLEMISTQSPRVTAVVGGALLDEHISRTLTERLHDSSLTPWLLNGPLGNLKPKIVHADTKCAARYCGREKFLRAQSRGITIF
jgi:hypothetical protein